MNNTGNFGLIDSNGEACSIHYFDNMLLGKKQNTLAFMRDKKYLHYRTSPSKDSFRHIDFIRNVNDFKLLGLAMSQIHFLGGYLEEDQEDYYLWKFGKKITTENNVVKTDYMIFSAKNKTVNIYENRKSDPIFTLILNLKNESDVFQFASLFAALKNSVAQELEPDSKKEDISYCFI
ncbi:MAG: hypothetical protein PF572_00545 [Patescibacteria group bacterium]|jgi:hypothetical protein|nr:hypothetical protein [Patescibacteria group bacterium]